MPPKKKDPPTPVDPLATLDKILAEEQKDKTRDSRFRALVIGCFKITFARFNNLDSQLNRIERKVNKIMSELTDAQDALAKVEADVANVQRIAGEAQASIQALSQQVADLQAQIAAGGDSAATTAALADIAARLTAVDSQLDTIAPDAAP